MSGKAQAGNDLISHDSQNRSCETCDRVETQGAELRSENLRRISVKDSCEIPAELRNSTVIS